MQDGTAKQIARLVALSALFLIPLAPLVVTSSFFFPFITGKGFFLRIMIEIAFSAWVVLALLDKRYRPRLSWIGIIAIGFVAWMGLADALAPNAFKAFWSNFERMEGWVLLVHLLAFLFVASSIFRVDGKWRAWFLTSVGVSVVIAAYALLQLADVLKIHQGSSRIDASFGNSAYLAIYLVFTVFIASWLAITEKQGWLKQSLFALVGLQGILLFFTQTRGAILGLLAALLAVAAATALTSGGRIRRIAVIAGALVLLVSGSVYLARDTAIVANNPMLERLTSISFADGQVRFTLWGMAWQGVLERPLVGWGQEGFNYVFNKYFDPSLYRQEVWFDRAHNAFIDWLSAGGIPAFLLYVSLYIAAFVLIWRRTPFSRGEKVLLSGALIGYAIHNLFVFDNLYSYIYFFAILALIDSHAARPIERLERAPEFSPEMGGVSALPIGVVLAFSLIWFVNVPGMRAANGLIQAMGAHPDGLPGNVAQFEKVVANPGFALQEVREQLIAFAVTATQSPQVPNEIKQRLVTMAISEMEKQVAEYPNDARERLQLAFIYRVAGQPQKAFDQLQAAIELSPRKEHMWLQAGEAAWEAGNLQAAAQAFNKAYELGPQFKDLAVYAAAGAFITGDTKRAEEILLDTHGTTTIDSDILSIAYYRTQSWQRLIDMWKLRVSEPGANAQTWFGLAAAYYAAGNSATAISTIQRAVELFPEAASSAEAAISQIRKNSAPQ